MAIKAVIFDYKALLLPAGSPSVTAARKMLQWLNSNGIEWCIFTAEPFARYARDLTLMNYPDQALNVDRNSVPSGKNRGSPDWIDVVTTNLGVSRHELLYVGCSKMDWLTAINAGVLYLHALWYAPLPFGTTSYTAESPNDVVDFARIFLSGQSLWSHRIDRDNWSLRSLLPAGAILPSTSPNSSFKLQDVFTYERSVKVGRSDARDVLMLFVLANAYLEGLIPANPYICVYPSSKVGKVSRKLKDYLDKAASLFHGYYREDLLVRTVDAKDTSLERASKRQVAVTDQANTVQLGEKYRGKLINKTVLVFDDFTTHGMSLEWARILLSSAGAKRIVMLTVGKYGGQHTRYELVRSAGVDPFGPNELKGKDFREESCFPNRDVQVQQRMQNLLNEFIAL